MIWSYKKADQILVQMIVKIHVAKLFAIALQKMQCKISASEESYLIIVPDFVVL